MLLCLRVHNFAIISHLEVEFSAGLNVVTGETGAGKSILVDALALVLGDKSRAEHVRHGAQRAEVEALFAPPAALDVSTRAAQLGLEVGEELIVRRLIHKGGRSRAYINGQMVTREQLQQLTAGLTDICSQHAHHALVHASQHLHYLDAYARLETQRQEVGARVQALSEAHAALQALEARQATRHEREDFLRFQLHEIESLAPEPGEEEVLAQTRERARHGEQLAHATAAAEEALYASDGALSGQLARLAHDIERVAAWDPALKDSAQKLQEASVLAEEAARDLGHYARQLHFDPEVLERSEERWTRLQQLKRKHGGSLEAVLAYAEQARQALAEMQDDGARRETLRGEVEALRLQAGAAAQVLSQKRHKAAVGLGQAVSRELRELGMGGARVEVQVAPLPAGEHDAFSFEGARLSRTGIDRAELCIAPNRGEAPQPLAKIASGGELSRALLGIKRVLSSLSPAALYVFDEVDSGVGGAVAAVIGQKLKQVAAHHQVLCITHLAQIAVFADAHFRVHKSVVQARTHSVIERLDADAQLEEVARMIGGLRISSKTRAAASEMLQGAR